MRLSGVPKCDITIRLYIDFKDKTCTCVEQRYEDCTKVSMETIESIIERTADMVAKTFDKEVELVVCINKASYDVYTEAMQAKPGAYNLELASFDDDEGNKVSELKLVPWQTLHKRKYF